MADLLDFTKPHVLKNESEYEVAVAEIDHLLDIDPAPGSEKYERLEFLSVLVRAYEDAHYPIDNLPTPQDVVDFMLEQRELTRASLAEWMGGKRCVSEFFVGKCRLSLRQIESLEKHLGIPADLLLKSP